MRRTVLTLALAASTIVATSATASVAQSAPAAASSRADTAAANRAALSATLAAQPQASPRGPARTDQMSRQQRRRGGGLRADTDGDGVVTRAEAIAQADARFVRMDADGDGLLTAAERHTFREATRQAMRERREQRIAASGRVPSADDPDRTDHRRGRGDNHRADRGGDLGGADRRGSDSARDGGVITRAEFADRAAQRFDRIDANRDGRLDANERPGGRGMRHGPGRGRHHAMSPGHPLASPDNGVDRSSSPDAATDQ